MIFLQRFSLNTVFRVLTVLMLVLALNAAQMALAVDYAAEVQEDNVIALHIEDLGVTLSDTDIDRLMNHPLVQTHFTPARRNEMTTQYKALMKGKQLHEFLKTRGWVGLDDGSKYSHHSLIINAKQTGDSQYIVLSKHADDSNRNTRIVQTPQRDGSDNLTGNFLIGGHTTAPVAQAGIYLDKDFKPHALTIAEAADSSRAALNLVPLKQVRKAQSGTFVHAASAADLGSKAGADAALNKITSSDSNSERTRALTKKIAEETHKALAANEHKIGTTDYIEKRITHASTHSDSDVAAAMMDEAHTHLKSITTDDARVAARAKQMIVSGRINTTNLEGVVDTYVAKSSIMSAQDKYNDLLKDMDITKNDGKSLADLLQISQAQCTHCTYKFLIAEKIKNALNSAINDDNKKKIVETMLKVNKTATLQGLLDAKQVLQYQEILLPMAESSEDSTVLSKVRLTLAKELYKNNPKGSGDKTSRILALLSFATRDVATEINVRTFIDGLKSDEVYYLAGSARNDTSFALREMFSRRLLDSKHTTNQISRGLELLSSHSSVPESDKAKQIIQNFITSLDVKSRDMLVNDASLSMQAKSNLIPAFGKLMTDATNDSDKILYLRNLLQLTINVDKSAAQNMIINLVDSHAPFLQDAKLPELIKKNNVGFTESEANDLLAKLYKDVSGAKPGFYIMQSTKDKMNALSKRIRSTNLPTQSEIDTALDSAWSKDNDVKKFYKDKLSQALNNELSRRAKEAEKRAEIAERKAAEDAQAVRKKEPEAVTKPKIGKVVELPTQTITPFGPSKNTKSPQHSFIEAPKMRFETKTVVPSNNTRAGEQLDVHQKTPSKQKTAVAPRVIESETNSRVKVETQSVPQKSSVLEKNSTSSVSNSETNSAKTDIEKPVEKKKSAKTKGKVAKTDEDSEEAA